MKVQAAIFKMDGTIKVIETDWTGREIEKFNQLFADDLRDAFKVVVNGTTFTYPYTVVDGRAQL